MTTKKANPPTTNTDATTQAGEKPPDAAAAAKPKPVTQSTRFTPRQMAEVERACRSKGWSISQMMLTATLEKALAINQIEERRVEVQQLARRLGEALHGTMPSVTYMGRELGNPEDLYVTSPWRSNPELKEDHLGIYWTPETGDRGGTCAVYSLADRSISIHRFGSGEDEDGDPIVEALVRPSPVEPAVVDRIIQCLEAMGSEMGPLLERAYNEILVERDTPDRSPEKFETVDDLLRDGQ